MSDDDKKKKFSDEGESKDKSGRVDDRYHEMSSPLYALQKEIQKELASVSERLKSLNENVDSIGSKVDGLDSRLTALENKVDARLQETRPIWESVNSQLAEVREAVANQSERIEKGFRRVELRLDVVSTDLNNIR